MENIINANIGGVSFCLNNEAYSLLEKYLDELSAHYKSREYGDEIMNDIESRIAELLLEKYTKEEVVTAKRIEEVIAIMGQPSDFYSGDNDDFTSDSKETESQSKDDAAAKGDGKVKSVQRRLFRDLEGKYIGGVCGGLGHYLRLDPSWIRILFLILLLVPSSAYIGWNHLNISNYLFLLYFVFWICVPGARTYTQKCAMLGIDPGVKGAEDSSVSPEYDFKSKPSLLERVVRWGIGLFLILIAIFILLVGMPVLITMRGLWSTYPAPMVLLLILCIIPFVFLMYEGVKIIARLNAPKWHPGLVMFILWLVSIIIFIIVSAAHIHEKKGDIINEVIQEAINNGDYVSRDEELIVDTLSDDMFEGSAIVEPDSTIAIPTTSISAPDSLKNK